MKDRIIVYIWLVISAYFIHTDHMPMLIIGFLTLYGYSYIVISKRSTFSRIKLFFFIGLIITATHIFLGSTTFMSDAKRGMTSVLKIAMLSQMTFVLMHHISMSRLISITPMIPTFFRMLIAMTFASIPILSKEAHAIRGAYHSRATGLKLSTRLQAPIRILVPLVHRVLRRGIYQGYVLASRGVRLS